MVVYGKEKSQRVAETDFNLAKYSETQTITDILNLSQIASFTSFPVEKDDHIEVVIKTQILDSEGGETPRKTPSAGLNLSAGLSKAGESRRRE